MSYAQEDRALVRMLTDAFEAKDWKVWWDEMIPTGQQWRNAISQNINEASCVVVVWTKASIGKEWVIEEAKFAKNQDKLIQVIIDVVAPPLGFSES